jgi:hypothetical protein
MTTFTFILVIGVIWSVTTQRKREDILGGFLETDQPLVGGRKAQTAVGDFYENWAPCPQRGLTAATMT